MKQDNKAYDLVVSVVLYNTDPQYIENMIDLVSGLKLRKKLVFVDNSENKLKHELIADNKYIEYIYTGHNGGYGYGHNKTIKKYQDSSKYIIVLNPDVITSAETLTELFRIMEADKTIGICSPKICNMDGTPQNVARTLPDVLDLAIRILSSKISFLSKIFAGKIRKHSLLELNAGKKPFFCPFLSGCYMFLSTDALQETGGFDERFFMYFEDLDLARRIAIKYDSIVVSELIAQHQWARCSYKHISLFKVHMASALKYLLKYGFVFDKDRKLLNNKIKEYVLRENIAKNVGLV